MATTRESHRSIVSVLWMWVNRRLPYDRDGKSTIVEPLVEINSGDRRH